MDTKANDFVHIPGDPRGWAPFEYLFRNRQLFMEAIDPEAPEGFPAEAGIVFCATRRKLPHNFPVKILVRLGRRRPPLQLEGRVVWRRAGKHADKVRAGVAVAFPEAERSKLGYVLDAAPAGDNVKSRRRHERIAVDLQVHWRADGAPEVQMGTLLDIGRGGAFVGTGLSVEDQTFVIVDVAPPGAAVAMSFEGRIAWIARGGHTPGFGFEWRARRRWWPPHPRVGASADRHGRSLVVL